MCDHLIRYITCTATEVPACPHVLSPVVLLDMWEFQHNLVRRFTFQPLHQPADRYLRWYRYQQMHVVFRHMSLHDLHIVRPADFSNQIADSGGRLSRQKLASGTSSSTPDAHESRIPCARRADILPAPKLIRGALASALRFQIQIVGTQLTSSYPRPATP